MKMSIRTLQYLLLACLLIIVNLLASGFFARIDLTSEKRYSLSDLSVETAKGLEYPMLITVYLEGEFPPNIRAFQDAIRTTLLEMKQYAGRQLEFSFVDPSTNRDLLAYFNDKKFVPVPVTVRLSPTETKQQYMWPLVVVRYREREVYVDLLKGTAVMTPQGPNVDFGKAEADLEYKLVSAMRKISQEQEGVVAMLQGHGERSPDEMPEMVEAINSAGYNLFTLTLPQVPNYEISPTIKVLMVIQPTRAFSERDKYELDQYLIRGGRILWMLNNQVVDLNMYRNQSAMTELRNLNLDDQFLNYGLRLNADLLMDRECEAIEVFQEGPSGGSFISRNWPFHPLMLQFPEHPFTRNADGGLLRYASTIDTFNREGLRHRPFLLSSDRSRAIQNRQFIELNQVLEQPEVLYNRQNLMAGVLTEGLFKSNFIGREAPLDSLAPAPPAATFGPQNNPLAPGAMVVIGDGNFPLGKRFRDEQGFIPYDNKTILMNAIDYLAGDAALTQIRSKTVVARRIDRVKAVSYAGLLRAINLGLPILLIAAFGLFRHWRRKRKHAGLQVQT